MNDTTPVDHESVNRIVAGIHAEGGAVDRAAHLLHRAEYELGRRVLAPSSPPADSEPLGSNPTEPLVQVLADDIDPDAAIVGGSLRHPVVTLEDE